MIASIELNIVIICLFSLIPVFAQGAESNFEVSLDENTSKILEKIDEVHIKLQSSMLGGSILALTGLGIAVTSIFLAVAIYRRQNLQTKNIEKLVSEVHTISSFQATLKKSQKEVGEENIFGYLQTFIDIIKELYEEVKLIEKGELGRPEFVNVLKNFEISRKLVIEYLEKQSNLF